MTTENAASGSGDRDRTVPSGDRWSVRRSALDGMALGVAISGAVASYTGANVLALEPLSEVVDVDALEALWREDGGGGGGQPDVRVTFRYEGLDVTVTAGELRLAPVED